MKSKTAILLFNRSSQEEAKAKGYYSQKSKKKAVQLSKTLRDISFKVSKQSGLPIINFNSKLQKGIDFGERITNAIQTAFQEGYDNLIVVGIDSPGLNYRHILKAKNILEESKSTVLGPSFDGGVYLIGINGANFNPQEFIELDWQTDNLQDSWKKIQTNIFWLKPLLDIDKTSDLWAFTKSIFGKLNHFHLAIIVLLNHIRKSFLPLKTTVRKQTSSPSFGFRAPPLAVVSFQ